MATNIYFGLHGARMPGDNDDTTLSQGNRILDRLGERLGCPVWDFAAATHPDPNDLDPYWTKVPSKPRPGLYPGHPGYLPTKAVKYLISRILSVSSQTSIRLFGWSTGAVMLCDIARDLSVCPVIPADCRKVDVCLAIDPLWSLAALSNFPRIPDNVRRWVCIRQNRAGNLQPTNDPLADEFWQGVRLELEDDNSTRYDELNVATGEVVGKPGFTLPVLASATHGMMPELASEVAMEVLAG